MPNILFINYEFPPIGGGGANANYYLLKEFADKSEIHIDLVTSSERREDYVENFSDNITIHRLDVRKKELHFWTQLEILTFLCRSNRYVRNLLKKNTYDLCHAFFGFPSGYIAWRYRKRIPYIVSLRGSDVPGFNRRFSVQYLFLEPIFKKIWRKAKRVIANSKELSGLALQSTPELPIDIIYNGIDTEEFSPLEKKEGGAFTILTVSRLIRRKGLDYLIRALPNVLKINSNVRLVIAGEGDMEVELKDIVSELDLEEHVLFKGRVEHDELPALYREADLFVLPSLWEGMSNTLLEAIASGLPVVVTETGGTDELVEGNGIIIPKEDSAAIAEAAVKLMNDPGLRAGMGERSREIAMEFSWVKVAEQYVDIYRMRNPY